MFRGLFHFIVVLFTFAWGIPSWASMSTSHQAAILWDRDGGGTPSEESSKNPESPLSGLFSSDREKDTKLQDLAQKISKTNKEKTNHEAVTQSPTEKELVEFAKALEEIDREGLSEEKKELVYGLEYATFRLMKEMADESDSKSKSDKANVSASEKPAQSSNTVNNMISKLDSLIPGGSISSWMNPSTSNSTTGTANPKPQSTTERLTQAGLAAATSLGQIVAPTTTGLASIAAQSGNILQAVQNASSNKETNGANSDSSSGRGSQNSESASTASKPSATSTEPSSSSASATSSNASSSSGTSSGGSSGGSALPSASGSTTAHASSSEPATPSLGSSALPTGRSTGTASPVSPIPSNNFSPLSSMGTANHDSEKTAPRENASNSLKGMPGNTASVGADKSPSKNTSTLR